MKLRTWWMAAPTVMMLAPSALAQRTAQLPPPEGTLLTWGVAAGLLVVVCLTAFLNPKRSHLG